MLIEKPIVLKRLVPVLFVLLSLAGCKPGLTVDEDNFLARVHNEYLHISDIEGLVPENTTARDSIVLVRNYVNNWVKTKLMAHQAQKNLTDKQLDFSQQLEDYRNSLIIFTYERELINQNLDTLVSEEEIENYYSVHLSDFELKENIAKVVYVVIDYGLEAEDDFEEIFHLPDSLLLDSLEAFSEMYARSYFLDTAVWIPFRELQELVPIENYSRQLFLKNRRYFKLTDHNNIYMLKFVGFKIKDDTSPLAFKRDDIRSIIVNKRKMLLIKKVRSDIVNKALQNNEFEIYYDE